VAIGPRFIVLSTRYWNTYCCYDGRKSLLVRSNDYDIIIYWLYYNYEVSNPSYSRRSPWSYRNPNFFGWTLYGQKKIQNSIQITNPTNQKLFLYWKFCEKPAFHPAELAKTAAKFGCHAIKIFYDLDFNDHFRFNTKLQGLAIKLKASCSGASKKNVKTEETNGTDVSVGMLPKGKCPLKKIWIRFWRIFYNRNYRKLYRSQWANGCHRRWMCWHTISLW